MSGSWCTDVWIWETKNYISSVTTIECVGQKNEFEINRLKIGAILPYYEKQTKTSKDGKTAKCTKMIKKWEKLGNGIFIFDHLVISGHQMPKSVCFPPFDLGLDCFFSKQPGS